MTPIFEIARVSEIEKNEVNLLMNKGFVRVKAPGANVENDIMLHPKHWKVCKSGDQYSYIFDDVFYLKPLTPAAEGFCEGDFSEGTVP